MPNLGAFALAQTGALGTANPASLRGLSNVLLVSNLNEEVIIKKICLKTAVAYKNPFLLTHLRLLYRTCVYFAFFLLKRIVLS